jgi:hypothetical protein
LPRALRCVHDGREVQVRVLPSLRDIRRIQGRLEEEAGEGRIVNRPRFDKLDRTVGVQYPLSPVLFPVGQLDLRGALVEAFEQGSGRGRSPHLDHLPLHGDHLRAEADLLGEVLLQLEIKNQACQDHTGGHLHHLGVELVVVRHRIDEAGKDQICAELLADLDLGLLLGKIGHLERGF